MTINLLSARQFRPSSQVKKEKLFKTGETSPVILQVLNLDIAALSKQPISVPETTSCLENVSRNNPCL